MNMLNSMCLNCKKFNSSCTGTKNQLWSGCIDREIEKSFKKIKRKENKND